MSSRLLLAAALLFLILDGSAIAQGRPITPVGAVDRPVMVTVQYTFSVPVKPNDVDSQRATMEQSRAKLYQMAAKECDMLLATIASSCQLQRLNVQTNVLRHSRPGEELLNVSGNAQFKIALKPKT